MVLYSTAAVAGCCAPGVQHVAITIRTDWLPFSLVLFLCDCSPLCISVWLNSVAKFSLFRVRTCVCYVYTWSALGHPNVCYRSTQCDLHSVYMSYLHVLLLSLNLSACIIEPFSFNIASVSHD